MAVPVVTCKNQSAGSNNYFGRRAIFIKETIQQVIENT